MTTDRDLDQKVRTWLDEPPPGPPDRDAVYARVVDRLPETHQRRHWWPFQWNPFGARATRSAAANGPHPQGRSRIMFTPVRAFAAVAVLALGGSLALIAGPLGPSQEPVVPGAELGAEEVARVTGTATYLSDTAACKITFSDTFMEKRGCGTEYELTMDDPRLSGLSPAVIERVDPKGFYTVAGTVAGSMEMQHADGAWAGAYQGIDLPDTGGIHLFAVLTGSGDYEGLSAVLVYHSTGDGSTFDVEGMILPSQMLVYAD